MVLQPNGVLFVEGSSGNDDITVSFVVTEPDEVFVEVHDPAGVAVVPPGCFRKDANTIHCPWELAEFIVFELRAGDDRVTNKMHASDVDGLPSPGGGVPRTDVDGGEGDDELEGSDPDATAVVLGAQAAGGGLAGDRLIGGPGKDKLVGRSGNDRLFGGPGKDKLSGGPGKDKLVCGAGKDVAAGGGGKDTAKGCEKAKSL